MPFLMVFLGFLKFFVGFGVVFLFFLVFFLVLEQQQHEQEPRESQTIYLFCIGFQARH